MNYERAYNRLSRIDEGLAAAWVWALTLLLVAFMAVVGNELHAAGLMSTDAAEGLVLPLQLIAAVGFGGFALHVLSLVVGLLAWADGRGDGS
jgi:hypothetical protein